MIARTTTRAEPFWGWRMVGAGFAVLFTVYGLQFSFGTFVDAVVTDTGWSESRLQLVFAVYIAAYSLLSIPAGRLTDRFGPRPVVTVGAVLLAAGYLLWAAAGSLVVAAIGLAVVAPIGMSASWVPCNATAVRWFTARRGTAVSLTTAGGSVANIAVPPVAALLIASVGWRWALAAMAVVGGVIMLGAGQVLRRDPESVGQHPDGRLDPIGGDDLVPTGPALTLDEAKRTGAFWLIFTIYALSFTVVFVPLVHIAQFATTLGVTPVRAATAISAIGVGGLIGRLVAGPVSDIVGRRLTVVVAFVCEATGFVGMAFAADLVVLYPSAVIFGFAYGASVAAFPPLVGDQFGRLHAGAIVGRLFGTAAALAAVGPYVAQLLVDATGSYRLTFLISAALNGAAVAMALLLPRPAPVRPVTSVP